MSWSIRETPLSLPSTRDTTSLQLEIRRPYFGCQIKVWHSGEVFNLSLNGQFSEWISKSELAFGELGLISSDLPWDFHQGVRSLYLDRCPEL